MKKIGLILNNYLATCDFIAWHFTIEQAYINVSNGFSSEPLRFYVVHYLEQLILFVNYTNDLSNFFPS